ncbi:zinc finger protein 91 isoform X1 [Tribolium castaneum]|uniref:Matotopetli n=2 Tax=Tribolium castaneum TaxID=7070 RepID=D6WSS8_TRICA|nr:PREDICTED: zinc finger protein 91 isoform X1 [Tribolium castaneum]EFA07470.1 matotopetli [Tribolium castaneum]|eukprot:XP_001813154.1 PREDICTED: zinc finger protein 91 isoform X1 [Tribolium castaneum]
MNNSPDERIISVINTHFISDCGKSSSMRYESDFFSHQVLSKSPFFCVRNVSFSSDELNFSQCRIFNEDLGTVRLYKAEDPQILLKRRQKLNIPSMIRCQNCETNYPTKYQYQRHQCEFNAEKVVLKPNADFIDIDKGKRVKYDCPTCGKQFVSKNNLERHQSSHESSKDNTCEHCKKQFVSENRLRIHKENHCKKAGDISKFYRSDVTVWKCKKCHEVFSSSTTAGYHVEDCTELIDSCDIKTEPVNDNRTETKTIEKISTEILLQCEFCNRTYADKQILLKHQKTHKTDKNYECVVCKDVFDSYITASQHWLKKCSEKANLFYLPKLTYCEFCDRTFKSHEILYTHKIKKKHYTPKIHDNIAEKASQVKDIKNEDVIDKLIEDVLIALEIPINKRKKVETENKENVVPDETIQVKTEPLSQNDPLDESGAPEKKKRGRKRKFPKQTPKAKKPCVALDEGFKYQCERCTEVWNTITELEAHREKEHAANFNCDECGQVLHSARALLIHSRAHKSLKPYVCDTCGRSYSQTSHLWQHMRFHQGIKPFACPHEGCEARYTIRPDLKDHIRKVHTRERPFKCSVCGKCFLTGSVYYQHRLIHTEDRRYGCDMCEKRFFRADALNNHKRIHTNERPYPCFVCGRLFRQKGDRNKHFRTQHPDAILN